MLKKILFSGILMSITLSVNIQAQEFTVDDNGIVKCEGAEPGDTGTLFGDTYEAVDRDLLIQRRDQGADLSKVCTSLVTDMRLLFNGASTFNQDIGNWDVSTVTNMIRMFNGASSFNQDIGNWDVSSVTDMHWMFNGASSFNQDIGNWDVSAVTDMSLLFEGASTFNQDIGNWDVSSVTDMKWMFLNASSFNQDIGNWDVSTVTNMTRMFNGASTFNQNIGNWNVSSVSNMYGMFSDATSFNQDIGNWDVSAVRDMSLLFRYARYFNQDIGGWDISSVTKMTEMFSYASNFNQDIGSWDVSSVTTMHRMFDGASTFNQDIGNWDVSTVTDMGKLFYIAYSFNQDLSLWCVENIDTEPLGFGTNSALANNYYPVWGACPGKPKLVILLNPYDSSENISITPSMKWKNDTVVTKYQLQVIEGFDPVVLDTMVTDTTYNVSDSLNGMTEYNWRVRGINENKDLTGDWSEIWSFTTETIPVEKIRLISPANDTSGVAITPTLSWKSDANADSFIVQISTDEFSTTEVSESITDTTFTAPELAHDTQYSWRVRGNNTIGNGEWSDTWSFSTIIEVPLNSTLLTPENGSNVNTLLPEFKWNEAERARDYILHIALDQEFSNILVDSTTVDTSLIPSSKLDNGNDYYWRVKASNEGGESDWSDTYTFNIGVNVSTELEETPTEYTLTQNYPNPFNPTTQIRYGIPQAAEVELKVFNMLGQEVVTLVNGKQSAGWHTATFDASGLSSGFYIYRIHAGEFVSTKKLMLIK
ncbi:MAG: BspA family leucine-rich repeat surface protein [Gracilimonas sp.]